MFVFHIDYDCSNLQPSEEQYSVLQGVFRSSMLMKILRICPTRNRHFKDELGVVSKDNFLKELKTSRSRSSDTSGTDKRNSNV